MSEPPLPTPDPGYARCVRCRHIFLLGMLRYQLPQLWCPWGLEQKPGRSHGHEDAATCECRRLAR
jgi:hypothetical protein